MRLVALYTTQLYVSSNKRPAPRNERKLEETNSVLELFMHLN